MKQTAQSLRERSDSELREELLSLRREHFNLRMQHSVQQLGGHTRLRQTRRNVARALTILKERAGAAK